MTNLERLPALQYAGNIRLKYNGEFVYAYHQQQGQIGAPYPWHFFISPRSSIPGGTFVVDANSVFALEVGHYSGGVTGYWVRYGNMAWQAIPGRRFSFWNEDQQAHGNPEDDEMFYFDIVDAANSTVKIRSRYSAYLHLDGASFNSGSGAPQAAVFTVVFP